MKSLLVGPVTPDVMKQQWRSLENSSNIGKQIVPKKVGAHTAEASHASGTAQLINAFGLLHLQYMDTEDSEGGQSVGPESSRIRRWPVGSG